MAAQTVGIHELEPRVGSEIAVSPWLSVEQDRIDLFARATDDHQWIHVDAERARKGPFGRTIAHGFLTLSLLPRMMSEALEVDGVRMSVNYGLNRVRFTSPVPSGSRLRARLVLAKLEKIDGGVQLTWSATVEREGGDKPCLVAEWLVRHYL
ncbi:MAG TPA: MaoC family dehydratase [Anaeromyxobacter sp.]